MWPLNSPLNPRWFRFLPFFLAFVTCSLHELRAQLTIEAPYEHIVIQRGNNGRADVFVHGQCRPSADHVEARLVARAAGQGTTTDWQVVEETPISGYYSGTINAAGGWYDLQVREVMLGVADGIVTLRKVGIGEVLLIVGHSNAQGGASPSYGAQNDRVTSARFLNGQGWNSYLQTASTEYLPLKFGQLNDTIAPFHNEAWYWGQLGDSLVNRLNVPVLLYGAAFGGSNMKQTYNSAYDIPFTHGFINYSIRMPYVNIRNTLNHYAPVTGLRGVLSSHGINDGGSSTEEFLFHSRQVVNKSRQESGLSTLPWMVARAAWNNGPYQHLLDAQAQQVATDPHAYQGPNLNQIDNSGRTDNLHFNFQGQVQAARLWADALVGSPFLTSTTIIPAKPQWNGLPPVTLSSGTWGNDATWRHGSSPTTPQDVYIKAPHTIELNQPKTVRSLTLSGTLRLEGNGQLTIDAN